MKTFLNVLYRRILYKIPLKLLLILLAIFGLLFACTKADLVSDFVLTAPAVVYPTQFTASTSRTFVNLLTTSSSINYDSSTICFSDEYLGVSFSGGVSIYQCTVSLSSSSDEPRTNEDCIEVKSLSLYGTNNSTNSAYFVNNKSLYCYNFNSSNRYFYVSYGEKKSGGIAFSLLMFNRNSLKTYFNSGYILPSECASSSMSSNECQSEYNLIPIEEVDSSYCESNDLCSSEGTPSDCPNVGVSNLFINDIFHPGAFNIIMNIPEEISRDYAYTNSGYNFNLDIEGYNVDYEKMQSVIDKQSYIPTNEDFQNIILLIGPYGKIIIFFVFLFIIWAWIKKPFKSKL